jgi:hypothetical protein
MYYITLHYAVWVLPVEVTKTHSIPFLTDNT